MESTYDQWAAIYDSVYSYVTSDIPFYVEEAIHAGGPVLELGCGTGRVTIPIAKAGIDIVGLDFSQGMLNVANRKLLKLNDSVKRRVRLVRADMRDFSFEEKFSLIIIPFRGFLSLLSVEDQVNTLVNVREHLAPGGRLAFNIFVPDLNMLLQEGDVPYHFRDVTDPHTGETYILWQQSSSDNYHQIINVRVIIEKVHESGVVSSKMYRDFQLRYVHHWEMHHMLRLCGFDIVEVFGDFDRSSFDETSAEMIWIAQPGV